MSQRYISKNFTAEENRCRCGDCDKFSADVELVYRMQDLRDYYARKVIVHSWFRCRAHNNRPDNQFNANGVRGAGSNDSSWHLYGAAMDFHVEGIKDHSSITSHLRRWYPDRYGIGLYDWGVHFDVRSIRADWIG